MTALFLLSALLLSPASSGLPHDVYYQGDLAPWNIAPTFDHGYLAVYGPGRTVSIYSKQGTLALTIPEPPNASFSNVAIDDDGTVALVESAGNQVNGRIRLLDHAGAPLAVITLGDSQPSFVAFAPDHSIWATVYFPRADDSPKTDYRILRHYSREGRELGRFLPRASFASNHEPAMPMVGFWRLRVARDRVAALLMLDDKRIWLETDLDGKEIGRWPVTREYWGFALTLDGRAYGQDRAALTRLDHATGTWTRISDTPSGRLLGADGNELVFSDRGSNILRWVQLTTDN